jgi:cytochrome bd-type quinol oxidase subunit 2
MNQDKEHLRLLAIFHYVVAGLAALFSFFPLLYSTIGGFMLYAAHHPGPTNQEPPPAIVGWIFVALGALFFFAGLAMAICILMAGRSLARQRRYLFAFVIACLECFFIPFGTILGVFTIIVLSRESVKTLFSIPVKAHR